jgi:hypothetical protein
MKRNLAVILLSVALIACKKEPGDGGNSSIRGTISKDVRIILTNPSTYQGTFPGSDRDVYIIYGDNISPDDRVQTNYKGEFEFKYLRPGKYKVYTFSRDTNAVAVEWDEEHMPVVAEVEIDDKKQEVVLSEMNIYDTE